MKRKNKRTRRRQAKISSRWRWRTNVHATQRWRTRIEREREEQQVARCACLCTLRRTEFAIFVLPADVTHQRTRQINVDHCQQATCSSDECLLHPLGVCGPSRWKDVQINGETHELQKEEHQNCGRRLQRRIGTRTWSWTCQCWTPKGTEKQWDYILVDDMIHMGSDHRSVMAQFVTTAPKHTAGPKWRQKEIWWN